MNQLSPFPPVAGQADIRRDPADHRGFTRVGSAALILLLVVFGGWGSFARISGAVVATGTVVVQGRTKAIQHLTGGTVSEITVTEGESVASGQLLVRLDDRVTKAKLAAVARRLLRDDAIIARLTAERDNAPLTAPDLKSDFVPASDGRALFDEQVNLFQADRAKRDGEAQQLNDQIAQIDQAISGARALSASERQQLDYGNAQLASLEELATKGLTRQSQVLTLKSTLADLGGQMDAHQSEIAKDTQQIEEMRSKILQIDKDYRQTLLIDLSQTRQDRSEAESEFAALLDELGRTNIVSPVTGVVQGITVHTVGGVVSPGAVLMNVVPVGLPMVVEAQVPLDRIDEVQAGQHATVRLSAFNRRTTPELNATVAEVSADRTVDARTNATSYSALVSISRDELERLEGLRLIAGMPVEVFITTAARTPFSYFAKPILDQLTRAMRE